MTPENWQKVSSALDQLLDLPISEQAQRLSEWRTTDPLFCAEIESLLEQQKPPTRFESPPEQLLADLPTALGGSSTDPSVDSPGAQTPERAGRYTIQGEIARGGMGAILRAFDPDFKRTLAIKILLPAARADSDAERRFLREARITGLLQHPGIPPIHELGRLDDGSPFFAMKLIDGRTLTSIISDASYKVGDARFVGIFEQICHTLAYAHRQSIIHRDLKPSNIMVGSFGEVQVMDWGLAKSGASDPNAESEPSSTAFADGALSRAGSVSGTPSYMAPEQARGETDRLDERCDVFGLGGILCAMLTGRPPFSGNTTEMLTKASRGDLTEAFAKLEGCGADSELIQIARKCLAPAQEDRYPNAGEVADAVTQYRESTQEKLKQAELAREKAQIQTHEERRRRRVTVSLLSTLFVVMIAGLSAVSWLYYLADSRRKTAVDAQTRSDETARDARAAIKASFVLATENPEFQKDGMQEPRRLLLDKALVYFREFTTQRKDDSALLADLADAHKRIAYILADRGELKEAVAEYDQAIALFEETLPAEADPAKTRHWIANCLTEKARIEDSLGKKAEAASSLNRTFAVYEANTPEQRNTPSARLMTAFTWLALGHLHYHSGKLADSLEAYNKARAILEPLYRSEPRSEAVAARYANVLVSIGHVLKDQGRPADAVEFYNQAAELREKLALAFPYPLYRSELARTYGSLSYAQGLLRQPQKALESIRKAIALREPLVEANKRIVSYRSDLATSYLNYGDDLYQIANNNPKKLDEVLAFREKALAKFLELTELAPGNVDYKHRAATTHVAVAISYRLSKKQTAIARDHLLKAKKIWNDLEKHGAATASHRFQSAKCDAQFALMHLYADEFIQAIGTFEKANAVHQELLASGFDPPANKFAISVNCANIVFCYQETKQFADALRYQKRVVNLREELVRESPQTPGYKAKLASAREGLREIAKLYVQNSVPTAVSNAPLDLVNYEEARLEKWETLAREYPGLKEFKDQSIACLLKIAALQAMPTTEPAMKELPKEQIDRVLATLKRAVASGFADARRLETDPAFRRLHDNPSYRDLIAQIQKRSTQ